MPILPATPEDIPQLLDLVNGAFRGDSARKGWTHEADLLEGPARTDAEALRAILLMPEATILKYGDDTGPIMAASIWSNGSVACTWAC